jgi:FkbM family methyltransferase
MAKAEAEARLQARRFDEARTLYAELCRRHPQEAELWFKLGAACGLLGRFAEAVDACKRAIALNPTLHDAHFNLGIAYQYLKSWPQAAESFRTAIALRPDNIAAIESYKQVTQRITATGMLTVNIRGGIKVCVPDSVHGITPYVLLEQEDWLEDEIEFVRRLLGPGMRAIDIGANYGIYSLTMARAVHPTGSVWAFEPGTAVADFMQRSIVVNGLGNIRLICEALSNMTGEARLAIAEQPELNRIAAGDVAEAQTETVTLTTLDDCTRRHGWDSIDFIKLDAEGEECNIVEGGRGLLSEESPLVMFELRHVDTLNTGLTESLQALGYDIYRLIPGLMLLAPFDAGDGFDNYQVNLFACKPDRAESLERSGLLARKRPSAPLTTMEDDAWRVRLLAWRYAVAMPRQTFDPGRGVPGWEDYRRALNHYAHAHAEGTGAGERYAHLVQSLDALNHALALRQNAARLQSRARIAWEAGLRTRALETLRGLAVAPPRAGDITEPFLSVSPRYERLDPGKDLDGWMHSSILEQLEKLRAFSSFFTGSEALKSLETLLHLGFASPEMERRRQLIRLRHGMQVRPQPAPALRQPSEENLNAAFWTGAAGVRHPCP